MTESCSFIRPLLDAYLDDELSSLDHPRVERHLSSCGECRAIVSEMQQLQQSLRTQALNNEPGPEYYETLVPRIEERFDLEAAERGRHRARPLNGGQGVRRRWPGWLRFPVVRVAFAGLVLVVAAAAVRRLGSPPMAPPQEGRKIAQSEPRPGVGLVRRGETAQPSPTEVSAYFERIGGESKAAPPTANRFAPGPGAPEALMAEGAAPAIDRASDERSAAPSQAEAILLGRENDATLPDSLWTIGWLTMARAKAGDALRDHDPSACRQVLLCFWRVTHRSGRDLCPAPGARETIFTTDRENLECLILCARE
jgi:hypothetical protein